MSRARWILITALVAVAALLPQRAASIVVRHDKSLALARELAADYPSAVSVLPDGAGVLVAPKWVLTAAHVADQGSGTPLSVLLGTEAYRVIGTHVHPDWRGEGTHDIALLELAEPVRGVAPAELYRGRDEVGLDVIFVGPGDVGLGSTGPVGSAENLHAATNSVDAATEEWLIFSFTEPPGGTEFEGVSGPGDSGGPALATVEGKLFVVGISVGADGEVGRYGVTEIYSRVSTYADWIDSLVSPGGGAP